MLKWDKDSEVTFHPDGHTVRDLDLRFRLEDAGKISQDPRIFRWKQVEEFKEKETEELK